MTLLEQLAECNQKDQETEKQKLLETLLEENKIILITGTDGEIKRIKNKAKEQNKTVSRLIFDSVK